MTKTQERRFNMVDAVLTYCDQHPDIVSANKLFQKNVALLKRQQLAIDEAVHAQQQRATGSQRAKSILRRRLCLEASIISGQVAASAADRNDEELKERNGTSKSDLEALSEVQLKHRCTDLLADARATLRADPDCGLNEPSLTQFAALIGSFLEQKDAPRGKVTARATQTKNLATLMRELTELLRDKLDKAALGYQKTHPVFYIGYKESRKIMDVARPAAMPGAGSGIGG